MSSSDLVTLYEILDQLKSQREMSRQNWQILHRIFKNRFTRAWGLVTERRIKKYTFRPSGRTLWVAIGNNLEYLIYPEAGYCSCSDFYFRVLDQETPLCYHILAQKIAETLDYFDHIMEDDEAYDKLLEIWKNNAVR